MRTKRLVKIIQHWYDCRFYKQFFWSIAQIELNTILIARFYKAWRNSCIVEAMKNERRRIKEENRELNSVLLIQRWTRGCLCRLRLYRSQQCKAFRIKKLFKQREVIRSLRINPAKSSFTNIVDQFTPSKTCVQSMTPSSIVV